MVNEITAGFETLMQQAPMTGSVYLAEAVQRIDEEFGDGFAEKHPILIGSFILVAAIDCSFATLAQQIHQGLSEVASAISELEVLDNKEELISLAEAGESIASAIDNHN